ncbi:MAG: GntR family transcriptional regulator, partial [Aestuariivirgaceae bacterium]
MARTLTLKPVGVNFSLKEHIYEVLKDAITSVNIYDEDAELRLDERQMSEQLGISRTPLREALARLRQEGFVEVVPRKGVYILRKSMDEILEMIITWAALESMAARLATMRASDEDIASLRTMVISFDDDEALAHMDEYSEANIEFHQRILELSHCKMLKEIADGLFLHMRAIRNRAMAEGDR